MAERESPLFTPLLPPAARPAGLKKLWERWKKDEVKRLFRKK